MVALVIFGSGLGAGYFARDAILDNEPTEEEDVEFSLYWEVWHRVDEQFYGEIPADPATTYGAIKGALATLDDPYTLFIEPEPAAQEKAQLEGQFGGIGAFIRTDEEGRVVLEPMRDRPAELAGLQNDDVLVAVDGSPITVEMTVDQIVLLIPR